MTHLTLQAVTRRFGAAHAVDSVDLSVPDGKLVCFLGPSGCGKTTLLRMIAGLETPTSGSIQFAGRDITRLPANQRDFGMVFQSLALFPHMTVAQNVAYPLKLRKITKDQQTRRVAELLELIQLPHMANRPVTQLSGGQRQRVALARAMIFEPRLILMDEPLSALDKQLRETMQIELKQLHRKLGATIIYVTHDQREALTMSNRVAIMNKGKIVQLDTPERLHDHPINAFVGGFIGEAALLPVQRKDDHSVALGDRVLRSAHMIPNNQQLCLVVHAEKLLVAGGHDDTHLNILRATVLEALYQGETIRVFLRLPGGETLSLRLPSNQAGRAQLKQPGEDMMIGIHPATVAQVSVRSTCQVRVRHPSSSPRLLSN